MVVRRASNLAPMTEPQPVTVAGNRWNDLPAPAPDAGAAPVTVIIPHYRAEPQLAITLAGLALQDHPAESLEVIVVDDGSEPPLEIADPPRPVTVIHQPRDGFGAGRARNRGAAVAGGDILLFLDADMVPDPGWVSAHAAWHAAYRDLLTLGFRTHVDFDGIGPSDIGQRPISALVADRPTQAPEWIEAHMTRTGDLTGDQDDLFRVVTAGNFGIRRDLFERIGGFDERFTSWGAEDTELGYRAFTAGALLVPVRSAHCWHQGLAGGLPDDHEARSLDVQRARAGHLIAHHGFRRSVPGRSYEVPRLAVHIDPAGTSEELLQSAERVLASRWHDLQVVLDIDPTGLDGQWLIAQLGQDPRVVFGSPSPAVPVHLEMRPGARIREDTIGGLLERVKEVGTAAVLLGGNEVARLFTTRARARAEGLGGSRWFGEAVRLFGTVTIDGRDIGWSAAGADDRPAGALRRKVAADSTLDKIWRRAKAVRSPREAASVVRWLANALRYRITGRTVLPPVSRIGAADEVVPTSDRPLGVAIGASGSRASRILAVSSRVVPWRASAAERLDLLLVDEPIDLTDDGGPAVLALSGPDAIDGPAVVPAVDPEEINPIRWPLAPSRGPVLVPGAGTAWDALPAALSELGGAVTVLAERGRRIPSEPSSLERVDDPVWAARDATHAVDLPILHRGAVERAAHLVTLAAAGVVVRVVDPEPELRGLLGGDLYEAVTVPHIPGDPTERELLGVRQRRAALRDHSLPARVRQLVDLAGLAPLEAPPVSVILSTNRPDYLETCLAAVARQTYPRIELVLALHGGGFGGSVEPLIGELGLPAQVVRVAHEMTLGDALNMAVTASSGTLITKFDDDDHYGADHVWDLVLAREYSRAQLVGKAAEFVYLEGTGVTVRRFAGRAESYTTTIGGGALLVARHDLDEAGGWRRIPRRVDRALVEDIERAEGRVYRTHGFGYVLVRHGKGHTWEEGDQYFLDQADDRRPGLALEWAGV